jgi:hypothetical protein
MAMMKRLVVAAVVLAACGTQRVNVCHGDGDCKDPAYPFCDVNGEYPAADGVKNVCTVVPDNCPVDRCGCTAGAVLSCVGDQLTTCASDGMSTTMDTCGLGCATDGTRCLTFEPSNGLGGALMMAAGQPDIVIPAGATIDTDGGTITSATGVAIPVRSIEVTQTGAPTIRAFYANSFVIGDVTVVGTQALGLVAQGSVTLQGKLDAAARGSASGPGGVAQPEVCAGVDFQAYACRINTNTVTEVDGAGGGGNQTPGGLGGGPAGTAGGQRVQAFIPLYGGCSGGASKNTAGTVTASGGGAGGAVEIVALSEVVLSGQALLSVGGGGGAPSAGGGSGGSLIIEAPSVQIEGNGVGVVSNGGAGGGCGQSGADAGLGTAPAATPGGCSIATNYSGPGGNGGTANSAAGDAYQDPPGTRCLGNTFGGAGGAVGRARIATRSGSYVTSGSPLLSVIVYPATLAPQ